MRILPCLAVDAIAEDHHGASDGDVIDRFPPQEWSR